MTALVYLRQDDALYLLTDGASYTDDGVVTAIEPKPAVMPDDTNMVIFTRGPAGSAHLAAFNFVDQFASFDEFVDGAEQNVLKWYFDYEIWMRRGHHPDLEFYFFGWSEKRARPEGYQIRCGYEDSTFHSDKNVGRKQGIRNKPFVRLELPDLSVAPGIFDKSVLAATKFPAHLKPRDLVPEVDVLHLMEVLRRTPCARFPGDPETITVGGHALLTRIDADGVTQKMLAEYPDAIGEPIQTPPPLDWERWRASREFRRKMISPASKRKM
jgi:hypothetical protein